MNFKTDTARHWMLVDDDEIILALLQYLLSTISDVRTHCFQSGADALWALENDSVKYEAVFTDCNMPGMNGLELRHRLHQIAPHLPIVLATGSVDISETEARLRGFCGLVRKPFTAAALRAAIDAIEHSGQQPLRVWELDSAAA